MRPLQSCRHFGLAILLAFVLVQSPAWAASSPGLFGTRETFSSDLRPFTKWNDVVARIAREMGDAAKPCPDGSASCVTARWSALVAELSVLPERERVIRVNELLNRVPYVSAVANWHDPAHWETPFEFLERGGQCEDYAIAKIVALAASGIPAAHLRLVVVRDRSSGLDHAVAVAYVDGEPLVLDNQVKDVTSAARLDRYQPYYSINQQGWWYHQPRG